MVYGIVSVVLLSVALAYVLYIRKSRSRSRINHTFTSEAGIFRMEGLTERFVICKDERFEFLVDCGIITACKDRKIHTDFVYYNTEDKVND